MMLQQVLNTLMHEDFRYFGIARSVTTGTSRRYVAMHEGVKCEKGRGEAMKMNGGGNLYMIWRFLWPRKVSQ